MFPSAYGADWIALPEAAIGKAPPNSSESGGVSILLFIGRTGGLLRRSVEVKSIARLYDFPTNGQQRVALLR